MMTRFDPDRWHPNHLEREGIEYADDIYHDCAGWEGYRDDSYSFGACYTVGGIKNVDADYALRIREGKIIDRGPVHRKVDFRVPGEVVGGKMQYVPETPTQLGEAIRKDHHLHWIIKDNLLFNLETIHKVDVTTGWCMKVPDEIIREGNHRLLTAYDAQ